MPRDWENEESSDYCQVHRVEHFGSCPDCGGLGEYAGNDAHLNDALADIGSGIKTESWDSWLAEQQKQAQDQMDQDEQYIDQVTNG